METIFTSWPAMIVIGLIIIVLILVFRFPKEISEKIKDLSGLGKEGARWNEGDDEGKDLPDRGLSDIQREYESAKRTIEKLSSKNTEIVKVALDLNKELEDTKVMLFFERLLRNTLDWQYFLLKIGCESDGRRITIADAKNELRENYPDFDTYVTNESFNETLDGLQTLKFLHAIRPYTEGTHLEFSELTLTFLVYVNKGELSI